MTPPPRRSASLDATFPGLSARWLQTTGNLELDDRFTSTAGVNLTGARIGGQFLLDRAHLASTHAEALLADHLTVEQDMSCSDGFTAEGEILLSGARIGGHLFFMKATLANLDLSRRR